MTSFKPQYVGPLDVAVTRAGQPFGLLSAAREQFTQDLRVIKQSLRHSAFGAALTKQELAQAQDELPNESMGDKKFVAAVNAWKKKWTKVVKNRLQVAGAKQPKGFDETFIGRMIKEGYSREEVEEFLTSREE